MKGESFMKRKLLLIILPALALVLALLPWGAVLHFAEPDGEPTRTLYSYFSLTPYGYANFGPFFTAILICALLALCILHFVLGKGKLAIRVVSIAGLVTSLMPLMFGISYFSLIGLAITLCMAGIVAASFGKAKQ